MKQNRNIIFSFIAIILGWLFLGIGYSKPLPYQLNSLLFIFGFLMMPSGFIFLIFNYQKIKEKSLLQKIQILNSEKQASNWNTNLYDLCLSNIKSIDKYQYDQKAFGSWSIESKNKRLVYDGKDSWLILQTRNLNDWRDDETIKKEDLNYSNLILIIKKI